AAVVEDRGIRGIKADGFVVVLNRLVVLPFFIPARSVHVPSPGVVGVRLDAALEVGRRLLGEDEIGLGHPTLVVAVMDAEPAVLVVANLDRPLTREAVFDLLPADR